MPAEIIAAAANYEQSNRTHLRRERQFAYSARSVGYGRLRAAALEPRRRRRQARPGLARAAADFTLKVISLRLPGRMINRDRTDIRLLGQEHNRRRDSPIHRLRRVITLQFTSNQRTTRSSVTRVIIAIFRSDLRRARGFDFIENAIFTSAAQGGATACGWPAGPAQLPGCRGLVLARGGRTVSGVILVAACAFRVTAMHVPASHPRLWPGRSAAVGKLGG